MYVMICNVCQGEGGRKTHYDYTFQPSFSWSSSHIESWLLSLLWTHIVDALNTTHHRPSSTERHITLRSLTRTKKKEMWHGTDIMVVLSDKYEI